MLLLVFGPKQFIPIRSAKWNSAKWMHFNITFCFLLGADRWVLCAASTSALWWSPRGWWQGMCLLPALSCGLILTPAFMFTVCRTKICGYKGAVSFYCCRSLSFGIFCPLVKMRWWSTVIFQGNILYCFPSLQRTAVDWLGRRKATSSEGLPNVYFSESQWNFRYSVICLIPDR